MTTTGARPVDGSASDDDATLVPLNHPDATPAQVADLIEIEAAAAERMTFFSDAVVAIAITLLALELPIPEATSSSHQVWAFFARQTGEYLAFLVSFWVIAQHWVVHHGLFRYLTRLGGRVLALNMVWLLLIVVTPVATRQLVAEQTNDTFARFTVYAVIQTLQGLLMAAMVIQMRRHRLVRADTPILALQAARGRSFATALAFAISIPAYLLIQQAAYAAWFLVPVIWLAVVRTRRRIIARRTARPAVTVAGS